MKEQILEMERYANEKNVPIIEKKSIAFIMKYIKENNIKDDFEITSEELESEGYLKEIKLDDKICAADISVKKVLIFKKYNIEFTCIKNKEQS